MGSEMCIRVRFAEQGALGSLLAMKSLLSETWTLKWPNPLDVIGVGPFGVAMLYTGSSVEAFVADLCARGLLIEDVPLQHCRADEFEPGSLKFICVTAPRENGRAQRVDFTSLPGAFGRLDRSCLGQGVVDEELVGQLQQALDG